MQIFVYVYVSFFLRFKRRVGVVLRSGHLSSLARKSSPFFGAFDDDDDDDDEIEKFLSSRFRAD